MNKIQPGLPPCIDVDTHRSAIWSGSELQNFMTIYQLLPCAKHCAIPFMPAVCVCVWDDGGADYDLCLEKKASSGPAARG